MTEYITLSQAPSGHVLYKSKHTVCKLNTFEDSLFIPVGSWLFSSYKLQALLHGHPNNTHRPWSVMVELYNLARLYRNWSLQSDNVECYWTSLAYLVHNCPPRRVLPPTRVHTGVCGCAPSIFSNKPLGLNYWWNDYRKWTITCTRILYSNSKLYTVHKVGLWRMIHEA